MADVIQCPQCDKKFRLPDNPPATFTCSGCGTLMDLSDFGGADEPARPERMAPGGAPRTRGQRRRGGGKRAGKRGGTGGGSPARRRGGGAGAPARGRRRGRGAPPPTEDYDDSRAGRRAAARAKRDDNKGILIGSIVALVVVVALVVIILASNKDDGTPTDAGTTARNEGGGGTALTPLDGKKKGATPSGTAGGTAPPAAGTGGDAAPPAAGTGSTPAGTGDTDQPAPAPKRPKKNRGMRISRVKLQALDWAEEVDAETRRQVEEAIPNLYLGGRDGREAEEFLVGKGRPVAGRVITEFFNLQQSPGFDNPDGASRAGVIDSILRKIDGWQERRWYEELKIRATSRPSVIERIAKRWTAWWLTDEWKTNPRDPFDEFSESIEDLKEAARKPKKKKKNGGYGKRAGG